MSTRIYVCECCGQEYSTKAAAELGYRCSEKGGWIKSVKSAKKSVANDNIGNLWSENETIP